MPKEARRLWSREPLGRRFAYGLLSETHERHPDGDDLGVWDFDSYGIRLRGRDGIPGGRLDRDRMKPWSQGGEAYAPIGAGLVQVSPEQSAAIVPQLHGCARNRGALLIESPNRDGSKPEVVCPGKEAGALVAAGAQPDDPKNE